MTNQIPPAAEKFIPIRFMDRDGNVSDTPTGVPVVKAVLMYEPDAMLRLRNNNGIPLQFQTTSKLVYALIDTGADNNYADSRLITHAGCPMIGTTVLHGATSTTSSSQHHAHIWFPDIGKVMTTDVFAAPLSENGRKFPLVIGLLILKQGKLVLDFPNKVFRLHLD